MQRNLLFLSEFNLVDLFYSFSETATLWFAKLTGAIVGSAISIAYLLPNGKREAATRFIVGFSVGLIFGPVTGFEISHYFKISDRLSHFEITLMGSAFASLCAWWALGILHHIAIKHGASTKI